MHLCNYCDFYKKKLERISQVEEFELLFLAQWERNQKFLEENNKSLTHLKTLYIGGGTPSLWRSRGAKFLKDFLLKEKITFQSEYEYTIEIDPGTCEKSDIEMWIETGVNRFSVGLQAYNSDYLKLMDRKHSIEQARDLFEFFKSKDVNYSIDLMIGLPSDGLRDIEAEIKDLVEFSPKHFSVYILKARKNYLHFKELPSDEKTRAEYIKVCEALEKLGYEQYEVSNFARSGFQSKHNQKYWNYNEVAAIGSNATGLLVNDKKTATRYQWKSLSAEFQTEKIMNDSLIIEKIFLSLRSKYGLRLEDIFTSFEDREKIQSLYEDWKKKGYIKPSELNLSKPEMTPIGYLMNDSLIDDIFKLIPF